ncbi:hypothetical protein HN51_041530 [Arachis hypogaea]
MTKRATFIVTAVKIEIGDVVQWEGGNGKINVPKICESSIASFATLVLFEESASIVVVVRGKEKCYDVWMMKDYWDEESWMKLYNVGHVEVISRIVGFYKGSQLL